MKKLKQSIKETKERSKKVKKEKVRGKVKNMKEEKLRSNKAITLIALVITIVLNCREAAMARVNNKEINILKI